MTTIAYRAGVLAADKQYTYDGMKFFTATKIFPGQHSALGYAGNPQYITPFRNWWLVNEKNASSHPEMWHTLYEINADDMVALLVHERFGVFMLYPDGNVTKEDDNFFAIGSGAHYARAAMMAGSNAIEAVKIATEIDIHSGGNIDAIEIELKLEDDKPKRRRRRTR